MQHQEKAALVAASRGVERIERKLEEMSARLEAVCELADTLITRKQGRPSKQDIEQLEELRMKINGASN